MPLQKSNSIEKSPLVFLSSGGDWGKGAKGDVSNVFINPKGPKSLRNCGQVANRFDRKRPKDTS